MKNDKIWYENGLQFSCTQCHDCCRIEPGYVFLSRQDLSRLAKHHNISENQFIDTWCRWEDIGDGPVLCLREKKNYDCIFWNGGCEAYLARPDQCRTYPFWKNIMTARENWEWESRFCPGIGGGKVHSPEDIKKALDLRDENPAIRLEEWKTENNDR